MKTTLNDLNSYLFESLDRLTNDDLSTEDLEKEIKRSEAVQKVAKTIIDNGNLALEAKKHFDEYGQGDKINLPMLGMPNEWLIKENKDLKITVYNLQKKIRNMEKWWCIDIPQKKKII